MPSSASMTQTPTIIAASDTQLDQDLVERLRAMANPEAGRDECFESLGSVFVESALWVSGAAVLWIVAAACSL